MSLRHLLSGILLLAATLIPFKAAPQAKLPSQANPPATAHDKEKTAPKASAVHQDEGERVFQQNCSRCHTAPDGFSSRISGTVARHMRVRASLSQHDEQELLRFLNP